MAVHQPGTPLTTAGTNVTIALTDFRFRLLEELEKQKLPEMTLLGAQETSDMLETRYPISVTDPIFRSMVADNPEYARIGEVFFELFSDKYQAGVVEKADTLRYSEWRRRGWAKQPVLHAVATKQLFERLLAGTATATALNPRIGGFKGGESTASCENLGTSTTIKIFQKGHPVNPLDASKGTYDNLYTGAATGTGDGLDADGNYPGALPLNVASVRIIRNLFGTQKTPNGQGVRGYPLTHIACGKDLEDQLVRMVTDETLLLPSTTTTGNPAPDTPLVLTKNPLKNFPKITPIINPYLDELGVWYPISADEAGECPWMTLLKVPNDSGRVAGMPGPAIVMADGLEWVIDDENSELYKHGSKVGPAFHVAIAAIIEAAAGITTPWRIKRCKAT